MISTIILVTLFSLSEIALLVFKRSKTRAAKAQQDKNSLKFLWIIIPLSCTAGTFTGIYGIWPFGPQHTWIVAGTIVFVIGFIIRWIAIIQLGKMFTVDVAIDREHKLINTGLYKIVRHPSYLGLLLVIAGIAISMCSAASCLILIVPVSIVLHYRMNVEEKALESEFKSQYVAYMHSTSRLIPGIY